MSTPEQYDSKWLSINHENVTQAIMQATTTKRLKEIKDIILNPKTHGFKSFLNDIQKDSFLTEISNRLCQAGVDAQRSK